MEKVLLKKALQLLSEMYEHYNHESMEFAKRIIALEEEVKILDGGKSAIETDADSEVFKKKLDSFKPKLKA